jgi:predicted outer membrane repeat protein
MPAWWSLTLVALFVAGLLLASPAHAAGVVGNGTPASCTEAALMAVLTGGGTVTFNCGEKSFIFTSEKVIMQDTVIQGGKIIIFNGGGTTRLFRVVAPAKLTLSDLALEKGYNPNEGGAVLNLGTLALNNVRVKDNASGTCGGAIWTQGAAIISNSLFDNNSAVSGGGAICTAAFGAPSVQITNSVFQKNGVAQAGAIGGYGGAISLNATATLTSAGAIYNLGSLNLYDASVGDNFIPSNLTVNGYGGGVASLGTLTVHNSIFYSNEGLTGGGLYLAGGLDSSRADLQQVSIENNRVKHNGGGIFADNTTLTITNTNISSNKAQGSGGGLACAQCARVRVSNSSFITNTAAYGGGLYVSAAVSGYAHVESVTFSGNQAFTSRGGAVYNQGDLDLYFSSLVNNGNGLHSGPGANTRLRGSVLYNPGYTNCGSEGTVQYSNDGANHVSDNSCGPQFSAKGDPKLGPLQFELQQQYWPTFFHLPLAGSPLINKGPGDCPERDQRGMLRPDACDIGTVEFGGLLPAPNPTGYPVYLPIIVR